MYRGVMLLVVFLCELAALAAFAWFGSALDPPGWARVLAGIGLPVAGAVVWGLFAAPRARFALPGAAVVAVKAAVYVLAALALVAVGHPVLGTAFLVVVGVVTGLVRVGHLDEGVRTRPAAPTDGSTVPPR